MDTVEIFLGTKHPKKVQNEGGRCHPYVDQLFYYYYSHVQREALEHDSWLGSAGILFAKQPQPNQPQLGRSSPQAERAVNTCTTAAVRSLTTIR